MNREIDIKLKGCKSFSGGLLGALDGLDLLQQEGPDDSGLHASSAEHASVWPGDRFVLLGQSLVVIGSQLRDSVDPLSAVAAVMGRPGAVTTLGDVLNDHSRSWRPDLSDLVGRSVVAESSPVGNPLDHSIPVARLILILIKKFR